MSKFEREYPNRKKERLVAGEIQEKVVVGTRNWSWREIVTLGLVMIAARTGLGEDTNLERTRGEMRTTGFPVLLVADETDELASYDEILRREWRGRFWNQADLEEGLVSGRLVAMNPETIGSGGLASQAMPWVETGIEGAETVGERVTLWQERVDETGVTIDFFVLADRDEGVGEAFIRVGSEFELRADVAKLKIGEHKWDLEKFRLKFEWVGQGLLELMELEVQAHSSVLEYKGEDLEFEAGVVVLRMDPKGALFGDDEECNNRVVRQWQGIEIGTGGCGRGTRTRLQFDPSLNLGKFNWEEVLVSEAVVKAVGVVAIDAEGCLSRKENSGVCEVSTVMREK